MKTLLSHPRFDSVVDSLVERHPDLLKKGSLTYKKFPDGTPDLFIDRVKEDIEHRDVTYIGDFSDMAELFPQYALVRGIIDYYADKVRVIVPYFPVGTMERISRKGEIATASYFADILSHLPPGRKEKTSIHTFDIHALVERFLFDPFKVNAELHTTTSLLELPPGAVIAFPDDGAAKRFKENFPENHDKVICLKVRGEGNKRTITIKEGNPEGKDIYIVDDLIQTGGTLLEAANLLRSKGAKSVHAFAPHGVFPLDSHMTLAPALDGLIVTDTLPVNVDRAKSLDSMRVLSIAPLVEKILLRES
ncbi:MAG: ribose-phosphate pyrophosphokinase [Candidatus Altimarinota bacterium]